MPPHLKIYMFIMQTELLNSISITGMLHLLTSMSDSLTGMLTTSVC